MGRTVSLQARDVSGVTIRSPPTRALATVGWSLPLGVILVLVGLVQSSDPPGALTGWLIASVVVLFGILLLAVDAVRSDRPRGWVAVAPVGAGVLLLVLLVRYQGATMPAGGPTVGELLFLTGLLGVFLLGGIERPTLIPPRLVLIGAFAVVAGLFLYHTTTTPAGSLGPTWPIWAVVVSGVCLLLIPRYVPLQSFLWSVSLLAGAASAAAVAAYIRGDFAFLWFEVAVVNQDVPFTAHDLDGWYGVTSVFNNINVFGLVAFAGLSASVFALHRSWGDAHRLLSVAAGLLVVLNGTGLVLSSSDASWIAAGVTLAFYGVYLLGGRVVIGPTVVVGTAAGTAAVAAVYLGHLPIDDGGRFDRWRSGIRAVRANPSWLGHGYVSTADFVQPYHPTGSHGTPHNSYLSVLIRMGAVGALAYGILLWGTIAYRSLTPDRTDVAMLAFAIGWGVHHLFESYTLVQWTPAAVLSALTLGYLLVADRSPDGGGG